MKKYLALLMLCLPVLGLAQTTHVVTFKVNTANITVGPNGLFAGGGVVGLANAVQLLDPDGNGVYEGSTTLTGNAGGNFGFFNSPAWDQDWNTKENLAGLPCADPANYNDRIMPTFTQDTTLLFCFGSCANDTVCPAAQADYLLTLKVNTANITVGPNGLYAGGGILGNARALQLTDADGNGVYEADTLITGQGGGNFIFLNSPANGGDWGTKESLGGLPCADPNNYDDRIMPSFGQDTTLMFCFGTCATDTVCPTPLTPVNVTFQSDRSNSPAFTNAYLSGTFPVAWNGTAYPMTDPDGDGVYTVVMSLTPGDYRYKFTADNWAIQENFVPSSMSDISCINTNSAGNTDRILTVGTSDTTLMIHAWEECGGSQPFPDVVAINTFNSNDATGVADSLGAMKWIKVIVTSIDFDGDAGYSFYGEDATDGINIYNFADQSGYTAPMMGDSLYIHGEVEQFRGLTELKPDSIYLLSSGNALPTASVETTLDETTESELIQLIGFTVVNPTQWPALNSSSTVDITNGTDTLKMRIDSDTDIDGSPAPAGMFDVTGLGSQYDFSSPYDEGYQIFPRQLTDIYEYPANVTIQIDMNNVSASSTGSLIVYVDILDANTAGYYPKFMSDSNNDGTYEVTFSQNFSYGGQYRFRYFLNGTNYEPLDLSASDSLCAEQGVGNFASYAVRPYTIGSTDTVFPVVCWAECSACAQSGCDELFFSEYLEGSAFNKALELYNPTASAISLSNYEIRRFNNGGTSPSTMTFPSSLSIPAYGTYVIADPSSASTILSSADTTSSITSFNGDDAIVLMNGTDTVDIIGVVGVDPGSSWPVGTGSTAEHTLVRKATVSAGQKDWTIGATEWDVYPSNTDTYLGGHNSNCAPPAPTFDSVVTINTFNSNDATGVADSLGAMKWIKVIVTSIDFDGDAGYSFYGEDATDGINIYNFADQSGYTAPMMGDSLYIHGEVEQFRGLTELKPDSIYLLSSGNALPTASVETTLDETTESELIQLIGFTVVNPTQWPALNSSSTVDITNGTDTLKMRIDSDTDIDGSPAPAGMFDVTGLGSQYDFSSPYDEGYQIFPRQLTDIFVYPFIPTYTIDQVDNTDADGVPDSLNVYCKVVGVVHGVDMQGSATTVSFTIHDGTEGLSAFSSVATVASYVVTEGDEVRIVGSIDHFNGLLQMYVDSVTVLSTGNATQTPTVVTALGESTESELVKFENMTMVDPTQWGSGPASGDNIDITNGNDTIVMRIDADVDLYGAPAPTGMFDVVGIGGQYDFSAPHFDGYQLLPRYQADIMTSTGVAAVKLSISEIMAGSNSTAYNADWFEIHNYGDSAVDLNGYSWDDESEIAGTSTFPAVTVQPGEAIVVLDDVAANKDAFLAEWKLYAGSVTIVANDELTGSFPSLSQNGDAVFLYDANGAEMASGVYSAATAGFAVEFDTTGAFLGDAVDGTNGAYTSLEGDVGSPGNLTPNTGVDEASVISNIYPNPTTGSFTVNLASDISYEATITNMTGAAVFHKVGTGSVLEIDLDASRGTYVLRVRTAQGTAVQMIVLQ